MWLIKWLEILLGIWISNWNSKINRSLRFICKYIRKLTHFSDFCKKFQGNFLGAISILHYKLYLFILLLRIFKNPNPIFSHVLSYSTPHFLSLLVHLSVGLSLVCPFAFTLLFWGFCNFLPHCFCPLNDSVTSDTAPAHLCSGVTGEAVYSAFFFKWSF